MMISVFSEDYIPIVKKLEKLNFHELEIYTVFTEL